MRLTVSAVIGSLCAAIVLAVAAITLAITQTVAMDALREVGKQHALALAGLAREKTFHYFDEPTRHCGVLSDLFLGDDADFRLPNQLPDQTTDRAKENFMDALWMLSVATNFSYPIAAFMFEDWSACSVFPIAGDLVRANCLLVHEYFNGGNMSEFYKFWHRANRSRAVVTDVVSQPPEQNRFAAYDTAKLLFGTSPGGIWFPIVVYDIGSDGGPVDHILPAAKPLYNATGHFLGLSTVNKDINEISNFLRDVRATKNTEAFAVQGDGYLIGSSHASPFTRFYNASVSAPVPGGCASLGDTTGAGLGSSVAPVGCRQAAADFAAYPPLQAIAADRGFLHTTGSSVRILDVDGDAYFAVSTQVPNRFRYFGVNIVLCMPEADVLGDVVSGRNLAIGVTAAVFVVASALAWGLVHVILRPLSAVSQRMTATARLRETPDPREYSVLAEVRDLQKSFTRMNAAITSFTRYVPRDVVRDLMASGELCAISMLPRRCTVLFADIAGFTTICERVPPDVLSDLVTLYFDRASRIVMEHDGMVDKYIGDCIMAVWGAPTGTANQEVKGALAGALLAREVLVDPLASQWDEAGELLRVRVGINTGEVLAGNMGSADRMNYTVIGDTVNLAARLESLNKQFGTVVMVGEDTAAALSGLFVLRLLLPIAVQGKDVAVKVYEVVGLAEAPAVEALAVVEAAEQNSAAGDSLSDDNSVVSLTVTSDRDAGETASDRGSAQKGPAPSRKRPASTRYRRSHRSAAELFRAAAARTAASDHPAVCSPDEATFAARFTAASKAYLGGDAAGAIAVLDELQASPVFAASQSQPPGSRRVERSMSVLRDVCEAYLKDGDSSTFTGVYRAETK